MAGFKASKKREKKAPNPVGEGTQLIPSAAIREKYYSAITYVINAMMKDYRDELESHFERESKTSRVMDATPAAQMQSLLKILNKKWIGIFKNYAKQAAEEFTRSVDAHSKATCWHSLSTAGVEQPRLAYNANIAQTLGAAVDFNTTLVTGIAEDVHEKIYSAVMLSLTSPNPEEQGKAGIMKAVTEATGFSKKRAELIARDQNSKLYGTLNIERMRDNGVDKFRWIHSSAGKVPRESHVAKDNEIFALDDPRLWQGKKSDQGPPGWAINCRCRAVPVI